jgi:hypothetical protein
MRVHVLAAAAVVGAALPNSYGCVPPANTYPWCNTGMAPYQRAAALVSALTLAEKIRCVRALGGRCGATVHWVGGGAPAEVVLLSPPPPPQPAPLASTGSLMGDGQPAIARVGLPTYSWNTEALHGLGAYCLGQQCPSIFPAPPTLGATWNASLMLAIGAAISDETRAFGNAGGTRHYDNRPICLNVWVPSLNLAVNPVRPPRGRWCAGAHTNAHARTLLPPQVWGRNVEVYGEDPWHAGVMGERVGGLRRSRMGTGANAPPPWHATRSQAPPWCKECSTAWTRRRTRT